MLYKMKRGQGPRHVFKLSLKIRYAMGVLEHTPLGNFRASKMFGNEVVNTLSQ